MDGSVHLLEWTRATTSAAASLERLCFSASCHTKYVVSVRWSRGGSYLATASHDCTAQLFGVRSFADVDRSTGASWDDMCRSMQRYHLDSVVEDVAFLRAGIDDDSSTAPKSQERAQLIVAERSSVYLHFVDVPAMTMRDVNVNERDDTHLSFATLAVVPSPSGDTLCVATDSDQLIIMCARSGRRLQTLFGHKCGQYAQPSIAWDPSEDYVMCTSQEDRSIYVWSLATGRVVDRLTHHTRQVRSIDQHTKERVMASGGFDKAVAFWRKRGRR